MTTQQYKNQSTTAYHQIPKEIREEYRIQNCWRDNELSVHNPAYINIEEPQVKKRGCTWCIENKKICVSLWIGINNMHVTVF